jgi:hypothetical protein
LRRILQQDWRPRSGKPRQFPGSNTYAFDDLEGTAIWTFTIALPGTQEPQVVLAVGISFEQEVAHELLGNLFKTAAPSTQPLILAAARVSTCGAWGNSFLAGSGIP